MTPETLNTLWPTLFIDALVRSGLRRLYLSPGSRSTPLTVAAARHPELETVVIVDERSAAFCALGDVRVTGEPVALLCTSGSAVAQWLPAVVEASLQQLPLLLLSADRPWEEHQVGAAQTIEQTELFGRWVREVLEVGLPEDHPGPLASLPRIAAQALARTRFPEPGPVQINFQFRKPLEPVELATLPSFASTPPRVHPPRLDPEPAAIAALAEACRAARSGPGLILCGPSPLPCDPHRALRAVESLARATGFPVLAESTSNVRFGPMAAPDPRVSIFEESPEPRLVLELGYTPTSAAYARWAEGHREVARHLIAPSFRAPYGTIASMTLADPFESAERLAAALGSTKSDFPAARAPQPSPAAELHRTLLGALPEHALLFVGNSRTIRFLDRDCLPGGPAIRVIHQRGANGIDGLIAGAVGASRVHRGPTALLLGDISALHDLGSLALARGHERPLVIVIANNHGGRLFNDLPIGSVPNLEPILSSHFLTEHPLDFASAAAQFRLDYARATNAKELGATLAAALERPRCTLVEALTA